MNSAKDSIRIDCGRGSTIGTMLSRVRAKNLLRVSIVFWLLATVVLVGVLSTQLIEPDRGQLLRVGGTPLLFIALLLLAVSVKIRLEFTPIIIFVAAAFIPFSVGTGTQSRIVDSLLLSMFFVGVWLVKMIAIERRIDFHPSPVNKPLIGFMIVVPISLIWSMLFRDPLVVIWNTFPLVQTASAIVMITLAATFLLVVNNVESLRILKVMAGVMLVAGTLGLIKQYGSIELPVNTDGLFAMWVVALSVSLALFYRALSSISRLLLLLLAGLWMYWGFGLHVDWLAGWLPGMIALGLLLLMRSRSLFIVGLLVLVLIILINPEYYLDIIEIETQRSLNTRVAAWNLNWQVTGEHLTFGTGPGGYAAYYMSYFPHQAMATHNNYVDILAQVGIIGLGFLTWFFGALAWIGFRLHQRVKGRGDFIEAMGNAAFVGLIGSLVMMAFGDWIIPFAYTQTIDGYDHAIYSWLFFGCLLVLDIITKKKANIEANV